MFFCLSRVIVVRIEFLAEKIWQLKLLLGKNSQIARKKDKKPELEFLPRQYK